MGPTDYDLAKLRRDFDSKFSTLTADLGSDVKLLHERIDTAVGIGVEKRTDLGERIAKLEEAVNGIQEAVGLLDERIELDEATNGIKEAIGISESSAIGKGHG